MKIFSFITQIIFPPRCPGCDSIMPININNPSFCKKCKKQILIISDNYCIKCGKRLKQSQKEFCQDCSTHSRSFTQGKGLYLYKGPLKTAMYRFKYSNRRSYSHTFINDLIDTHGKWISSLGVEAIIPVPMYYKKEKKRGYNQANILAKELSRKLNIAYYPKYIVRSRSTLAMKNLNSLERRKNLENAFKLSANDVQFSKVLIIDDIFTTGATMEHISQLLRDSGTKEIYCISICIGEDYGSTQL